MALKANPAQSRGTKCLFAFTPADAAPDGVPVLAFLMPEAGWSYMQNGMCHEFDLTNVGIPLQVVIGRCVDHADGMNILRAANALGAATKDITKTDIDMHLGAKKTRQ